MEKASLVPESARLTPHFDRLLLHFPVGFVSIQLKVSEHYPQVVDSPPLDFDYYSKSSKRAGRAFLPGGFFAALGFL
jgi:hypothetical protein